MLKLTKKQHGSTNQSPPAPTRGSFVFTAYTANQAIAVNAKSLREAARKIHDRVSTDDPPLAIVRSDCLVERAPGKITALVVKPRGPALPI